MFAHITNKGKILLQHMHEREPALLEKPIVLHPLLLLQLQLLLQLAPVLLQGLYFQQQLGYALQVVCVVYLGFLFPKCVSVVVLL